MKASEDHVAILDPLIEDLDRMGVDIDRSVVRRAFDMAREAHRLQRRRSGEPYVTHPVAVARILVELLEKRVDSVILAAALLHDVVEDTQSRIDDLNRDFGEEVATLVDGVTKIEGLQFSSTEA
ncbi:MAG TPA: HD domain-containing protein, partial [Candidatus Eisenbacteria bacterium]|nr:HD domain-containing protein [Candidatus Eisenbacteria bacterium]